MLLKARKGQLFSFGLPFRNLSFQTFTFRRQDKYFVEIFYFGKLTTDFNQNKL
jgi:hypothetical protein